MWRPTSGKPNVAVADAMRTSQSRARPKPPATAGPLTAATAGLGKAERRGRRRDADAAEGGEAEAACDRGPVDRRDGRHGQARHGVEEPLARLDELLLVGAVAAELRGVHAGAERRAGAGED